MEEIKNIEAQLKIKYSYKNVRVQLSCHLNEKDVIS